MLLEMKLSIDGERLYVVVDGKDTGISVALNAFRELQTFHPNIDAAKEVASLMASEILSHGYTVETSVITESLAKVV